MLMTEPQTLSTFIGRRYIYNIKMVIPIEKFVWRFHVNRSEQFRLVIIMYTEPMISVSVVQSIFQYKKKKLILEKKN